MRANIWTQTGCDSHGIAGSSSSVFPFSNVEEGLQCNHEKYAIQMMKLGSA